MKSISIIHPSRGRAGLAHSTADEWTLQSSQPIEYIISVDSDDSQLPIYKSLFKGCKIVISKNKNVVEAMNAGARVATGDVLVCISDDMGCFPDWNETVLHAIDNDMQALQCSDGIVNKPDSAYFKKYGTMEYIMTLPILTRKLYEKLGYIYYPAYTGMFADNDLAECCHHLNALKQCHNITFLHRHFTNGMAQMDQTYARHNNRQSWLIGEKLIAQRRSEQFGFPTDISKL